MSNFEKITSTYLLLNLFLLVSNVTSTFENRIKVESNYIFVKYDHELKGGKSGFHHTVNTALFNNIVPSNCATNEAIFCRQWQNFGKFEITKKDNQCEQYELTTTFEKPLRVRFDTSNVYLYGGAETGLQTWPADFVNFEKYAYVTNGLDEFSIVEPFWLVSNGMYLYVDQTTPLFISQNKNRKFFELIASRERPYVRTGGMTKLKYTLCKLDNMKEAYMHAVDNILGKPMALPDELMVKYPIWSTWAKYKAEINTTIVMEYADLITKSGLPNSQLEIDDNWETCYGSLTVDQKKFRNMKNTIEKLKNSGYRVTFWAHPFVNLGCEPYHSIGVKNGYFVKSSIGSVVGEWWNGRASQIDFTNPEASAWWQNRLKKLKAETGLDSYKFDAGESTWGAAPPVYHQVSDDHPETNLKYYIEASAEFGGMVEVRSARGTQKHPIFLRMVDRESNWEGRYALSTLIPSLLMMNVLGYPFVLPDMVGGNGYNEKISSELFIRWLQANVFMPSIQFSYLPSEYGENAVQLTKKFVNLHAQYADKIIELMKKSVKHGTPVNPPIWWIDPTDPETYLIDSEFLLGEDVLVAPVIQQGARSRDIYLPKGHWRDEVNKDAEIIKGPVWLYNYPADIDVLPYFTKVAAPPSPNKDDKEDKKSSSNVITVPTLTSIVIVLIFGKLLNFRF